MDLVRASGGAARSSLVGPPAGQAANYWTPFLVPQFSPWRPSPSRSQAGGADGSSFLITIVTAAATSYMALYPPRPATSLAAPCHAEPSAISRLQATTLHTASPPPRPPGPRGMTAKLPALGTLRLEGPRHWASLCPSRLSPPVSRAVAGRGVLAGYRSRTRENAAVCRSLICFTLLQDRHMIDSGGLHPAGRLHCASSLGLGF